MCQAAAPGSVRLCREGASRAASGARPQKMPETVAAQGRLREGGPGSPVSSGQVLVGTLCADRQREPSAETPAVLGTDLIHEVNTESDTSGPSPGGVEITGTFPSLRSCQLDLARGTLNMSIGVSSLPFPANSIRSQWPCCG